MDPGDQNITLDEFMLWKVDALREYLTRRGLSKDGNKNELAALCYSANVMKLQIVPTSSEIIKQNADDYKKLLHFQNSQTIPDPRKLYENWLDEKNGISQWPPVYISDIIQYLTERDNPTTLRTVLQDYKIGKAYEYFYNGFLEEIFLHAINNQSPYCILRAKCTPSQKMKDEQHDVLVCVCKESGKIMSSYCTCTAG